MSTAADKETIKMIRAQLNRLTIRIIVIRIQRRLFGVAADVSICAFSSLATSSLSVRTFWLKRMLLRISCNLHPMICWILKKSKNLIEQQRDVECRVGLLMHALDYLKSTEKVN